MVCADSFSAVLTSDGEVYAWGSFRDPSGVIGFSKQMERQSQPLPKRMYFGNEKVVLLGSGENHIFAVTDDETIWAFGANDENQLGRRVSSRFKNNLEPYEIKATGRRNQSLHNIIKITGGAYHTLYINSLGHLYALGCNNCGQLGLGDTNPHINGPERIEWAIAGDGKTRIPMPQVVDIAAGESHSIAVSADGRVFSWGANLEGQLGYTADRPIYGDYRDGLPITVKHGRKTPSPPTSVRSSPAKQRQASQPSPHAQSEASDADRESYKLKYQPMPRQINADCFQDDEGTEDYIVQVDAQSRFSIAVSAFGNLYTWGSGHCYQLGNEEMEDCPTPYCVQLKTRKCFWARCGGQFTAFLLEPKREEMKEPAMMTSTARGGGAGGRGRQRNGGSPKRSLQQFQNNSNGNNANGSTADNNYPQFDGMDTSYSYRMKLAPPTSLPTSPVRIPVAQTSPMRQSPGVPLKDATQALLSTFESVCVSPEKKRVRMEHDPMSSPSRQFTREEKMAPWSPTKRNSPALFNSPMQEDADENGEVLPVKKQPAVKKAVRSSIAQRLNALSAQQQQQQQQSQQQPQQQHPHQSGATTRSLRNRKPI